MADDKPGESGPQLPVAGELSALFADPDGKAGRILPVGLPVGRLVWPDPAENRGAIATRPAYWLSGGPAPAGVWSQLHAQHARSGLWPLLLEGLDADPSRPWAVGEVMPEPVGAVDGHDPEAVLATSWADCIPELGNGDGYLAPFHRAWPGLATPGELLEDPEVMADRYAAMREDGKARLGLVAAGRGADTLVASGWTGPANYFQPTAPVAAVVRSWEDRFGVRVVRVGFATLELSVAAPPVTAEHALHVAAEHFAFCPDNLWQSWHDSHGAYAEQIRGKHSWGFWWD